MIFGGYDDLTLEFIETEQQNKEYMAIFSLENYGSFTFITVIIEFRWHNDLCPQVNDTLYRRMHNRIKYYMTTQRSQFTPVHFIRKTNAALLSPGNFIVLGTGGCCCLINTAWQSTVCV